MMLWGGASLACTYPHETSPWGPSLHPHQIHHDHPDRNTQDIPETSSWTLPHKITWSSCGHDMDSYCCMTSPKFHSTCLNMLCNMKLMGTVLNWDLCSICMGMSLNQHCRPKIPRIIVLLSSFRSLFEDLIFTAPESVFAKMGGRSLSVTPDFSVYQWEIWNGF